MRVAFGIDLFAFDRLIESCVCSAGLILSAVQLVPKIFL